MSNENIEPTGQGKAEALISAAVVRRRILLKGVGKGASVLATIIPIQTLAGQNLLTFDGLHQCSISGMQSGVHSATPLNTPVCGGYSISYWALGNGSPTNTWPTSYQTKFSDVFTHSNLTGNPSLFQVMKSFASTDEAHWLCAWLNALNHSFNFPYTGPEVLAFYNNGPSTQAYQDALTFFKTYMENHIA